MKIIRTCNCGNRHFTKEDVIKLIKTNFRPWETDNKDIIGFLFDCDLCGSTLIIKMEVLDIEILDLIDTDSVSCPECKSCILCQE